MFDLLSNIQSFVGSGFLLGKLQHEPELGETFTVTFREVASFTQGQMKTTRLLKNTRRHQ